MPRDKRVNGAGTVYIKHGSYYGRWRTVTGRRTNRRLGLLVDLEPPSV